MEELLMALPVLSLISAGINLFKDSKVGKLQVPGASQTVGEMTASKTGVAVITIITFSINHIQDNPESYAGWIMLGICLLTVTIGDRIDKIYKIMKEIKESSQ